MSRDYNFFSPWIVAIGKGAVYLLAYITSVALNKAGWEIYACGVLVYNCGCIFEYIEIAANTKKAILSRRISAAMAILLGVSIVVLLGGLILFVTNDESFISDILEKWHQVVDWALMILWLIPLVNGIVLIFGAIGKETRTSEAENEKGDVSGYGLIP